MVDVFQKHFADHCDALPATLRQCGATAQRALEALITALRDGNKVLAFGNGGSATQASHLVGELVGRFSIDRKPLAAIALADAATVTCVANDFGFATVFERQLEALAARGDIAIGLTTSGRSENVLRGLFAARQRGCVTIALTGAAGLIGGEADHVIAVPSSSTAVVQELHLMFIHAWCSAVDAGFSSERRSAEATRS